ERVLLEQIEVQEARIALDRGLEAMALEELPEPRCEVGEAGCRLLVEQGTMRLQVLEDGEGCRQSEGMADEGAGEEGCPHLRHGIITIPPGASIQRIHEFRLAGQDTDGKPAADDLAISGEVGPYAGERLHAAGMDAEARDDLVHDEGDVVGFGDP